MAVARRPRTWHPLTRATRPAPSLPPPSPNPRQVKIRNFLPPAAAAGLLALLRRLPPSAWNDTSAARDYAHNDISHAFESTKEAGAAAAGGPLGAELAKAFRALSLLQPGALFTFSAARYTRGHHIEPHDDRAYTNVRRAARALEARRARAAALGAGAGSAAGAPLSLPGSPAIPAAPSPHSPPSFPSGPHG